MSIAAVTGFVVAGVNSANAATTTVEYGGVNYDLYTEYTSYDSDSEAFMAQPWWGDASLATELATLVQFDLGDTLGGNDPTVISAPFVYGVVDSGGSLSLSMVYVSPSSGVRHLESGNASYGVTHYVFASSTTSAAASASKTLRPASYTSAPDLIPSNVPTCSGSKFVSGVQVLGNGGIQWFVEHSKKDECFNVDVTVLPEGVSAKDMSAVLAVLGSNFDVYALR